jgi:hypothetical protein
LWLVISEMTCVCEGMSNFLELSGNEFLFDLHEYLRKELKIPRYSAMFEDFDQFSRETEQLFLERPGLKDKLGKIKCIVTQLVGICESDKNLKVSFAVFEGLKVLANTEVSGYRGLNDLREAKSDFIPMYENEEESNKAMKLLE